MNLRKSFKRKRAKTGDDGDCGGVQNDQTETSLRVKKGRRKVSSNHRQGGFNFQKKLEARGGGGWRAVSTRLFLQTIKDAEALIERDACRA